MLVSLLYKKGLGKQEELGEKTSNQKGLLASPEDKGNIKMPQKHMTLWIMPQDIMGMVGGRPDVFMCFTDISHRDLWTYVLGIYLQGTAQKLFPSLYHFKLSPHSTVTKYKGKQPSDPWPSWWWGLWIEQTLSKARGHGLSIRWRIEVEGAPFPKYHCISPQLSMHLYLRALLQNGDTRENCLA